VKQALLLALRTYGSMDKAMNALTSYYDYNTLKRTRQRLERRCFIKGYGLTEDGEKCSQGTFVYLNALTELPISPRKVFGRGERAEKVAMLLLRIGEERKLQQKLHEEIGVPDSTTRAILYDLEEGGIVRRSIWQAAIKLKEGVNKNQIFHPLARDIIALLERGPISYSELTRKLRERGFSEPQITYAMKKLERLGAIEKTRYYRYSLVELTETGNSIRENLIVPWYQIALDAWEPPGEWGEKVRKNFNLCVRALQDRTMQYCISISRALKDKALLKHFVVEFEPHEGYVFIKKDDATLNPFSVSLKREIITKESRGVSPIIIRSQLRQREEYLKHVPWGGKMWQEHEEERRAYLDASKFLRCWLGTS